MNEMVYGADLGPRLAAVEAREDFTLLLTFNNGEQRIFDVKPLFDIAVFSRLKNLTFFKMVKAKYGTVEWPDDIDYCPDCLYAESVPA